MSLHIAERKKIIINYEEAVIAEKRVMSHISQNFFSIRVENVNIYKKGYISSCLFEILLLMLNILIRHNFNFINML